MEMFDYSGMEESGEAREKHGRPWDTEDAATVQAAEAALAARMAAGGTAVATATPVAGVALGAAAVAAEAGAAMAAAAGGADASYVSTGPPRPLTCSCGPIRSGRRPPSLPPGKTSLIPLPRRMIALPPDRSGKP